MVSEISVIIKNEEKRQVTKHLVYDAYQVNESDEILKGLMDQAVKEFNAEVESIKIKISMEVK